MSILNKLHHFDKKMFKFRRGFRTGYIILIKNLFYFQSGFRTNYIILIKKLFKFQRGFKAGYIILIIKLFKFQWRFRTSYIILRKKQFKLQRGFRTVYIIFIKNYLSSNIYLQTLLFNIFLSDLPANFINNIISFSTRTQTSNVLHDLGVGARTLLFKVSKMKPNLDKYHLQVNNQEQSFENFP